MGRNKNHTKEPRVNKFRLTLADANTHRQLKVAKFTRWSFFMTVLSILLLLTVGLMLLIALTPMRSFIPGYPDADTKKASIQNAIKIDSLENLISKWEFYSENLKRVFEGEDPVKIDSIIRNYSADYDTLDAAQFKIRDSILRQTVMEAEKFSVGTGSTRSLPIEGKHFFTPLSGVIIEDFDQVLHPSIDISAPANSVVMAVLDGTVISADWSDEYEYSIVIQHSDNIVSIYRKNQKLLLKIGDKVKAGTSIALIGDQSGDFLHFELWYNGEVVNPTNYINF